MSKINLYMDEDSGDIALVLSLRDLDVDVLTVQEASREGIDACDIEFNRASVGRRNGKPGRVYP